MRLLTRMDKSQIANASSCFRSKDSHIKTRFACFAFPPADIVPSKWRLDDNFLLRRAILRANAATKIHIQVIGISTCTHAYANAKTHASTHAQMHTHMRVDIHMHIHILLLLLVFFFLVFIFIIYIYIYTFELLILVVACTYSYLYLCL